MELFFLIILFVLMVIALSSGFPVAFALPGSAIISIGLAAFFGYFVEGNASAYFMESGPIEWLTAGVTNFRSLYWDVERDTLIAIPLFIFMGIMLERSKIAEDLLVTMARLFGPIPGGLGISVVFVGTLLAATTGIVGATVIAMGLISLPAMLRHNYSRPLATGTICASGTLGQIIPPSIVLILLADQLSSASDIASTARKALYKASTGEFSMPSTLDVVSTSAGEMFMGAFIPGLVLVGLYMLYILITALIRPKSAPPVPYEGRFDVKFWGNVGLSLIPPLALIFAVLGSIILGIATVNQAGSIGAIGALIMSGYRLAEGKRGAFFPAILAVISVAVLFFTLKVVPINVRTIDSSGEVIAVVVASLAVLGLALSIGISLWRVHKTYDILNGVMIETAKTTSMVFIILIGAAMLTSAFRGFGGEVYVKEFLTGMPGGFWTQFIVVMAVIFILGFFLDFIEIAVVVVPIVAPILMMDPSANITAVWLGVMIGLNIQTSFLTPPFGFALFYLRGVASKVVKTVEIYKGVIPFIALQLTGLAIVGYLPSLVNYLPSRVYLTSDVSPPPMNPKLQDCLEDYVFERYVGEKDELLAAARRLEGLGSDVLPKNLTKKLNEAAEGIRGTFERVAEVQAAHAAKAAFEVDYRSLHRAARFNQNQMRKLDPKIQEMDQALLRAGRGEETDLTVDQLNERRDALISEKADYEAAIPESWEREHKTYVTLLREDKTKVNQYRRGVDEAYTAFNDVKGVVLATPALKQLGPELDRVYRALPGLGADDASDALKDLGNLVGEVSGTSKIKSGINKARRAVKGGDPDINEALAQMEKAIDLYFAEVAWREKAFAEMAKPLEEIDALISKTIGLRQQAKMTREQALFVASCNSHHKDVSLNF
jgi:tripartite ATP-independent transporter DctM subunit